MIDCFTTTYLRVKRQPGTGKHAHAAGASLAWKPRAFDEQLAAVVALRAVTADSQQDWHR